MLVNFWRRDPESNWAKRICNPLHNRFAIAPNPEPAAICIANRVVPDRSQKKQLPGESGAGDESRTRDLNLGKVALYQLSYSRLQQAGNHIFSGWEVKRRFRAGTAKPCVGNMPSTKASALPRHEPIPFLRPVR